MFASDWAVLFALTQFPDLRPQMQVVTRTETATMPDALDRALRLRSVALFALGMTSIALTICALEARAGHEVGGTSESAALAALPPDKVSTGAGIVNLFLMLGGSFGISALVVVLERRVQLHGEALTATQNAANEATRALIGEVHRVLGTEGIPDAAHNSLAYKYLGDVVEAQANTLSFQDGFIWVAIAAVISLIPATILMLQKLRP